MSKHILGLFRALQRTTLTLALEVATDDADGSNRPFPNAGSIDPHIAAGHRKRRQLDRRRTALRVILAPATAFAYMRTWWRIGAARGERKALYHAAKAIGGEWAPTARTPEDQYL